MVGEIRIGVGVGEIEEIAIREVGIDIEIGFSVGTLELVFGCWGLNSRFHSQSG